MPRGGTTRVIAPRLQETWCAEPVPGQLDPGNRDERRRGCLTYWRDSPKRGGPFCKPRSVRGPAPSGHARGVKPMCDHLSRPGLAIGLKQPTRSSKGASRSSSRRISLLLGLAPDGGCLAGGIAAAAGGLLHHLFTLTEVEAPRGLAKASWLASTPAVLFCGPIRELPRPGVTRHPALWSADFPRTLFDKLWAPAIARTTNLRHHHKRPTAGGQLPLPCSTHNPVPTQT